MNCGCDSSCDFLPPVEYFSPIKVSHFEAHFTNSKQTPTTSCPRNMRWEPNLDKGPYFLKE